MTSRGYSQRQQYGHGSRSVFTLPRETGASITPIIVDHRTELGRETILAVYPQPDILVGAFVAMFCSEFADATFGQSRVIDGGISNITI